MLFSIYELSFHKGLDHCPGLNNNYYPAWRYRLREIIKILQRPHAKFFPIDPKYFNDKKICEEINNMFFTIKKITEEEDDIALIKQEPLVSISYREVESDVARIVESSRYFNDELKNRYLSPSKLYQDIETLILRLANGLPPNAVEYSITNRRPASFVEIINAARFFKISGMSAGQKLISQNGIINPKALDDKDMLNRLTLKAIEYADIETEYAKQNTIASNRKKR